VTAMSRHILHLRFTLPAHQDADLPEQLRRLLEDITPCVRMSEPSTAVLGLTVALPYWKRDARALTEVVQLRTLAHFGLHTSAGCAGNRMLAAMVCALTPPGRHTVIDDSPEAITASCGPGRYGNCPAWARRRRRCSPSTACTPSATSPISLSPPCSACSAPASAAPCTSTPTAATPTSSTPPRHR
jgi:hypothetical protein